MGNDVSGAGLVKLTRDSSAFGTLRQAAGARTPILHLDIVARIALALVVVDAMSLTLVEYGVPRGFLRHDFTPSPSRGYLDDAAEEYYAVTRCRTPALPPAHQLAPRRGDTDQRHLLPTSPIPSPGQVGGKTPCTATFSSTHNESDPIPTPKPLHRNTFQPPRPHPTAYTAPVPSCPDSPSLLQPAGAGAGARALTHLPAHLPARALPLPLGA
jgi:hypothetical protein